MEKKQELIKIALSALVIAASLPSGGEAVSSHEIKEVYFASGGCGLNSCSKPSLQQTAPGDGYYDPSAMNKSIADNHSIPPAGDTTGQSSYQGTSTGPGPNGGYPGTPRGTYNTETGSSHSH